MAAGAVLTREGLERAFGALDVLLRSPVELIMGGGTAMMMAYRIPVRTTDVDAYPVKIPPADLDRFVKQVSKSEGLAGDWLNTHYATFAHVLPPSYGSRLRDVFVGKHLRVRALGPEDLLVMKCFAGRAKDVAHAKALVRLRPDLALVEQHIESLLEKRVPGAQEALDFLDDVREQIE